MTLDEIIDQAKDKKNIQSDSQLARVLGWSDGVVSQYRKGRSYPSDDTMLKLSVMASITEEEGLMLLNMWRSQSSGARKVYRKLYEEAVPMIRWVIGLALLPAMIIASPMNSDASTVNYRPEAPQSSLWENFIGLRYGQSQIWRTMRWLSESCGAVRCLGYLSSHDTLQQFGGRSQFQTQLESPRSCHRTEPWAPPPQSAA